MGEILGLGMSHYPPLSLPGNLAGGVTRRMADPLTPASFKDVETWPEEMRREWADDQGLAASERHRAALIDNFRWIRGELDAFNPDVVLIWGDDQYENFKEDIVPAVSVLAYDDFEAQPWHNGRANSWAEPPETTFRYKGHRSAGKYIVTSLLEQGIDVAYAYKPLHDAMPHAFLCSAMYLDWDRRGFPYPILPFALNCYGRKLIVQNARGVSGLQAAAQNEELDPPSPHPWRCFDIGRAVARAAAASPWRFALIASSSWSHSFLTSNTSYCHPDTLRDRRYYEALKAGDWALWRETPLAEVEAAGHHELLNWFCLAGAMSELDRRPQEARLVDTWVCTSNKVFAVFRP